MWPNVGDPTKIGRLKFGRLRRLRDSARNCSEDLSRKVVFFTCEKLMVWKDGLSRILRPALPKLPCGGTVKAAVLNQRSEVGDATCGLPATFGRSLAPKPCRDCPVLLLSKFDSSATVQGRPAGT